MNPKQLWLVDYIIASFLSLICVIIVARVTYKIWFHLFKCDKHHIFHIPCCVIRFSDRHNWIYEPSALNKVLALISSASITLSHFGFIVLWITRQFIDSLHDGKYYSFLLIPFSISIIGPTTYYLYLVTTLEYQMNSQSLIKSMVPSKFIIFIKFLIVLNLVLFICLELTWFSTNFSYVIWNIPYVTIIQITSLCIRVFDEISILYLYLSGLNNVCRYWYSKNWEEYTKHGETERSHEILIRMTRSTVIMIISFTATMIFIIWYLIKQNIFYDYTSTDTYIMADILVAVFQVIDDITYGSSIYFMFEFGYDCYRTLFNGFHQKLYRCFLIRHKNQINRSFNGKEHESTFQQSSCCCKNKEGIDYYIHIKDEEL